MKTLKRISAFLLVLVMVLSAVGCLHKKNETAVTIDGIKFTSAYYMCALINAKSEAQSKVYENLEDSEKNQEIDYFSKKIDKKSFTKWTEDRAIEMLKEIAAYKSLCKKANLKIDDNTKKNAESMASSYWQYGYSQYFEPNGVSLETYTDYTVDAYYSALYFEHIYGKGGKKEIAAEEVKNSIYENFIIADTLEVTFSEETDSEKASTKAKFESYFKSLQSGESTFEEVYTAQNGPQEDSTSTDESAPKDKYASILGKEGTGYDNSYFEDISKMAVGEVKLITKESDAGYLLVVKQDIKADPYYLDTLDITARHLIKDDEYAKDIEKTIKDLKIKKSNYAIGQFKVKDIIEPNYQ